MTFLKSLLPEAATFATKEGLEECCEVKRHVRG